MSVRASRRSFAWTASAVLLASLGSRGAFADGGPGVWEPYPPPPPPGGGGATTTTATAAVLEEAALYLGLALEMAGAV